MVNAQSYVPKYQSGYPEEFIKAPSVVDCITGPGCTSISLYHEQILPHVLSWKKS